MTAFVMLSSRDRRGRLHATTALELASCATPPRYREPGLARAGVSDEFAGEAALAPDITLALGSFMADLPLGAELAAEYLMRPGNDGMPGVRMRLLVRSQRLPPDKACDQADLLLDRLALCLRVLGEWYAFLRCAISASDELRWSGPRLRLEARSHAMPLTTASHIGFTASLAAAPRALWLPRPASGMLPGVETMLTASGRCCLRQSLRAATGLAPEGAARIVLRRRRLAWTGPRAANNADVRADKPGARAADNSDRGSIMTRNAEAREDLALLAGRGDALEIRIEAAGNAPGLRPWLRLLGGELFPRFEFTFPAPRRLQAPCDTTVVFHDLRNVLAPGTPLPPLLPAPSELEWLGFPSHFRNPVLTMPQSGLLLGRASAGGAEQDVHQPLADRDRHIHVVGATGSGKTTLILNMAVQDMRADRGLAVIDPHGDLHEQLMLAVPPERRRDIIVIDPSDERFCPSLNPLAFVGRPDYFAVCRVVNELLDLFELHYDMKQSAGPGFEDYFRNAMVLAAAGPSGGPTESDGPAPTLASIAHVFRDRHWRAACIDRLEDAYGSTHGTQVAHFWQMAERTTGDHQLENWGPYVTCKLTRLTSNATPRRLLIEPGLLLNFRRILDEGKILLINLSKGGLGSADVRLVGSLLTRLIFRAALSRADLPREQRVPFHLYLDEFQNFVGPDVPELLAESRKYGLALVLAHQTLSQLADSAGGRGVLDAVSGNVASRLYLRMGRAEAERVAADVAPHFDARTLVDLPDRHAVARLQLNGRPTAPFVLRTLPAPEFTAEASLARTCEWAALNLPRLALRDTRRAEQALENCEVLAEQKGPPVSRRAHA